MVQPHDLKVGDTVLVSRFIGFSFGFGMSSGEMVWERHPVSRVTKTTLEVKIDDANLLFTLATGRQRGQGMDAQFARCFVPLAGNEEKESTTARIEEANKLKAVRRKLMKEVDLLRTDYAYSSHYAKPVFDMMTLAELDKLGDHIAAARHIIRDALRRR